MHASIFCDPLLKHILQDIVFFSCSWNEWLTLPVKYSDLPRNAILALTVWDVYGPREAQPVGGSTITLFGKNGWVWENITRSSLEQTVIKVYGFKRGRQGLV